MYGYSTTDSTDQRHLEPSPASRSWGGKERSLTWHIHKSARLTGVGMGQFCWEDASCPPREASGQEMWLLCVFVFWKSSAFGPGDSANTQRRSFPPAAWLCGGVCAQTSPKDAVGHSAPACVAPGRARALPRVHHPGSPCQQQLGEATESSWRRERQFWFLFCGQEGVPGQAASAVRSPAPSQTG